MNPLIERLRSRKVVQWTLAYLAGAFVVLQLLDILAGIFSLPAFVMRAVTILLAAGALAAVIIAWFHGEKGQQRTSGLELLSLAFILVLAGAAMVVIAPGRDTSASTTPSGQTAIAEASVAVLPFVNMSADQEQEFFADGISEEILNALAQVKGLSVAARTSAFAFKNTNEDIRSIARKLGVAAVLEGSVRKQGEQLRITAQLINAANGYHLWSETFDRGAADIFAVQDEIARAIVDVLKIQLSGGAGPETARGGTTNLSAHELYLLGLHHFARRTDKDMARAIEVFEQAIAADSSYALAYAGLAGVYAAAPYYLDISIDEAAQRGRAAATKALALDSTVAEAYAALGDIAFHADWNMREAERLHRRAIALKPSYMQAYNWLTEPLTATGRTAEALAIAKRALELDPLSLRANKSYGFALLEAGQPEAGLAQVQKSLALDTTNLGAVLDLASICLDLERWSEAAGYLQRYAKLSPKVAAPIDLAARALLDPSLQPSALRELQALERSTWLPPHILLPQLYLAFGAKEETLQYFERKYAQHDIGLPFVFNTRSFRSLRSEPHFRALAQKVGVPLI